MGTDSSHYRVLHDWIAGGVRPDPADTPDLVAGHAHSRAFSMIPRAQQLSSRALSTARPATSRGLARYGTTDTAIAASTTKAASSRRSG
jgi:hypothetical protein